MRDRLRPSGRGRAATLGKRWQAGYGVPMETTEISRHQVAVFEHMKDGSWKTANEVALATKVAGRTARHHLAGLTQLGVLEEAYVFPGHRYRLHPAPGARATKFIGRLEHASVVLGDKQHENVG